MNINKLIISTSNLDLNSNQQIQQPILPSVSNLLYMAPILLPHPRSSNKIFDNDQTKYSTTSSTAAMNPIIPTASYFSLPSIIVPSSSLQLSINNNSLNNIISSTSYTEVPTSLINSTINSLSSSPQTSPRSSPRSSSPSRSNNSYHPYQRQQQQQTQSNQKFDLLDYPEFLNLLKKVNDNSLSSDDKLSSPPSSPLILLEQMSSTMTTPSYSPKLQAQTGVPALPQPMVAQIYQICYPSSQLVTPIDCFRKILGGVIKQLSDLISQKRTSNDTNSTHYLGNRFPINQSTIESFVIVSLFINSHSLERISDYWSTVRAQNYPTVSLIPRILSRNKYFEIKSSLSTILSSSLIESLQLQLGGDIISAFTSLCSSDKLPNLESMQAGMFKSSVKHRNSTKELASFNLILECALSNITDLFNKCRHNNNQNQPINIVQIVEILTEQICPLSEGQYPIEDLSQFQLLQQSNNNNSNNFNNSNNNNNNNISTNPSTHMLLHHHSSTHESSKTCYLCSKPNTMSFPTFKCGKCQLSYHRDCFNNSHH